MDWTEVERAVPDLGAKVRGRFESYGLGIIATLRLDGAPRIAGVEPLFGEGELWLGMMPRSLKARDLARDPRFALHSATIDKDVSEGDAKISGRARAVADEATFDLYRKASGSGEGAQLGSFHLFRVEVESISHLIPAGDHLLVEWWNERDGYRRLERY